MTGAEVAERASRAGEIKRGARGCGGGKRRKRDQRMRGWEGTGRNADLEQRRDLERGHVRRESRVGPDGRGGGSEVVVGTVGEARR